MTIDELNQQSRLLNEFFVGVQQDRPIPEVDPTDLKRFHENVIERSREAGPGAAIGLSALGLGQSISGEDAGPLCVRNWVLGIALMQGLLGDWQQGTELNDSVYRVAAIPANGIKFDPEAFVTRLRAERRAQLP
jgi:hypothetical protein